MHTYGFCMAKLTYVSTCTIESSDLQAMVDLRTDDEIKARAHYDDKLPGSRQEGLGRTEDTEALGGVSQILLADI